MKINFFAIITPTKEQCPIVITNSQIKIDECPIIKVNRPLFCTKLFYVTAVLINMYILLKLITSTVGFDIFHKPTTPKINF